MKRLFLTVLSICMFAVMSFGQIVNPQSVLENDSAVRYGKLANGMTYYIQHNEKPADRAEFYLVTNVGAIEESPAQDGLAHFLEHMCLNGTKNLPGKMMIDYFQTIGVEFGRNINASTGVEMTQYMLNNIPVTRQGIIDTALLIMHDYSHFVTNDPAEVEKERGVIVEEWRTRRTADWRMYEQQMKYLYKGSKYATCTVIGDVENIKTFDPIEIKKLYETWYRPDMQAVIVVGDIDVDAIEKQIKELFADIPAVENPTPKTFHQIPDNEEPIVGIITDPENTSSSITIFFKSQPLPIEYNNYGLAYIDDLMKYFISYAVNERMNDIATKPNAPYLGGGMGFGNLTNTMDAMIGVVSFKEGKEDAQTAFTALMTEFEKLKRYGITDAEFERAKTELLNSLERQVNNAESRTNAQLVQPLISNFIDNEPYMTPEYEYNLAKGYVSLLNAAQINQALTQMDLKNNAVIIYKSTAKEGLVHPTEAELVSCMEAAANAEIEAPAAESVNEPLLTDIPKAKKVKKTQTGDFGTTVWTLKNGIKVTVKPTDFNKEEVLFAISNKGGLSLVETEDLASMNSEVIGLYNQTAGVADFSETTLSKMLTGKRVNVNMGIGNTYHGFSGSSSPKDFETLLQLVYLYYTNPRFNEEDFNVAANQLKAYLPNVINQPSYILSKNLTETLFGNNPRRQAFSPETLEKMDFKVLEKNVRMLFSNAKGAEVTIVGNVNPDEIKPLVETYLANLPTGKKATKAIDRNEDFVKGEIVKKLEIPMETPKSTVFLVLSGNMPYTAENVMKMEATNMMLDLIYTETIREEEGGTYGVQSYGYLSNVLDKEEFVLQITFDTDPEKVDRLVELTKEGLNKLATEGPTQEMLNKFKENTLKNIPEDRIRNSYWKRMIDSMREYNIDFDSNKAAIAEGLTVDSIKDFVKNIVDQKNTVEIVTYPAK